MADAPASIIDVAAAAAVPLSSVRHPRQLLGRARASQARARGRS